MAERYDAIVIDAGLGGLSGATFLARNNLNVLLLERHSTLLARGRSLAGALRSDDVRPDGRGCTLAQDKKDAG